MVRSPRQGGRSVTRGSAAVRTACVIAVLVGVILALSGFAVAAVDQTGGVCDGRRGSTSIESPDARVFTFHGFMYACARPSGHTWPLLWRRPQVQSNFEGDVQLAGRFVAWKQADSTLGGSSEAVVVLDLKTGQYVQAVWVHADFQQSITEYVLNPRRTVVSIENAPGFGMAVNENTVQGGSTLDEAGQINSLALSQSGLVAYWTTNGAFRGAQIP